MGINSATLMGVVSKGPEFRMTQSGIPTCNLTLAVTRPSRTEGAPDITDYVRVIAWRALAERVNETVSKDDLVVIEGRLTTRSYETNDGQRRKTVEVEATAITPVRGGGAAAPQKQREAEPEGPIYDDDFGDLEESAPAPSRAPSRAPAAGRAAPPKAPAAPAADFDDEIPF